MKIFTFSADDNLIEKASNKAQSHNTTLNADAKPACSGILSPNSGTPLHRVSQHCAVRQSTGATGTVVVSFYDLLIIAAALTADCKTLFSEDLQHEQRIESLTIINPFANHLAVHEDIAAYDVVTAPA